MFGSEFRDQVIETLNGLGGSFYMFHYSTPFSYSTIQMFPETHEILNMTQYRPVIPEKQSLPLTSWKNWALSSEVFFLQGETKGE